MSWREHCPNKVRSQFDVTSSANGFGRKESPCKSSWARGGNLGRGCSRVILVLLRVLDQDLDDRSSYDSRSTDIVVVHIGRVVRRELLRVSWCDAKRGL